MRWTGQETSGISGGEKEGRGNGERTHGAVGSEIPLSLAQTTVNSGGPGPERVRSLNLSRHRRFRRNFAHNLLDVTVARIK